MTSTPEHPRAQHAPRRLRRLNLLWDAIKFGAVGAGSYLIDLAIFNALLFGAHGWLADPVVDKSIGIAVATAAAWIGNRYWTFQANRRHDTTRELFEFILVALAGWLLNIAVLWFAHYVLGWNSKLADNISGNVIGAFLGTLLRFASYRWWVYARRRTATKPLTAPQAATGSR